MNTRTDIIRWWEVRRYSFNALLLAVGFASWLLLMIAGSAAVEPGRDFVEPLSMFNVIAIPILLANIFYTLGWIADIVLYSGRPRIRLYKSVLIFTAVLTAIPGTWAVVAWLMTVFTGRKLD